MKSVFVFIITTHLLVLVLVSDSLAQIVPVRAELPRSFLDTSYNSPTGGVIRAVRSGDNLQSIIDAANPGDIIELEAGATFTGNFILPIKNGGNWIYIRSSEHSRLPAPGSRIKPEHSPLLAKIQTPNTSPAIRAVFGAHHYRIVGLEITSAPIPRPAIQYALIILGDNGNGVNPTAASDLTDQIYFDRCYIHGTPSSNLVNAINPRSRRFALVDSYISEVHSIDGPESQVLQSVFGTGPFKIDNNFISSAGIGVIIGGGSSNTPDLLTPADLVITGNHFYKPLSWKKSSPTFQGIEWTVKNQFELKFGRRILFEKNILENNWQHAQAGYSILLTPRDNVVEDVTIRKNIILNSDQGFQIAPAQHPQRRITIENNIFLNKDSLALCAMEMGGTAGRSNEDLIIKHNTFIGMSKCIMSLVGTVPSIDRLLIQDNIFTHGSYGIKADGRESGYNSVYSYTSNFNFINNLFIATPSHYVSNYKDQNNFVSFRFATDNDSVGFSKSPPVYFEDLLLTSSSPYKNKATDGADLGVEIDKLIIETSCVVSGMCDLNSNRNIPSHPKNLRFQ